MLINRSESGTDGASSAQNSNDPIVAEFFDLEAFNSSIPFFIIPQNIQSIGALSSFLRNGLLDSAYAAPSSPNQLAQFIPQDGTGGPCINVSEFYNLSDIQTQINLFQLIAYLYSNNHLPPERMRGWPQHPRLLGHTVLEIPKHNHNMWALQRLISGGHATLRSFARVLLLEAIKSHDISLATDLVRLGLVARPYDISRVTAEPRFLRQLINATTSERSDWILPKHMNEGFNYYDDESRGGMKLPGFESKHWLEAVRKNDMTAIKKMISQSDGRRTGGGRSRARRRSLKCAFFSAAQRGTLEMMKLLLPHLPLSKGQRRHFYGEALIAAANSGEDRLEKCGYLLSQGADTHTTTTYPDWGPFYVDPAWGVFRVGLWWYGELCVVQAALERDDHELLELLALYGALQRRSGRGAPRAEEDEPEGETLEEGVKRWRRECQRRECQRRECQRRKNNWKWTKSWRR